MIAVSRLLVEARAEVTGDRLVGHAAVFEQLADMGRHWEAVDSRAFDDVLSDDALDVRALWNHDPTLVLGRTSAGTLRLDVDRDGLAFDVDLPDTTYAGDLRVLVERGDLSGASFGFVADRDAEQWSRGPDGRPLRTVRRIVELRDVSPVTFPAFGGAGVALRHDPSGTDLDRRHQLIRARARVRAARARSTP